MLRRLSLSVAVLVLVAFSAQAEIQMILKQSLFIPPCQSWDVQHWMDEDSYGYAYLSRDTVYWAARIGDDLGFYVLPPDSVYFQFPPGRYDYQYVSQKSVKLLHLLLSPNNPCALVSGELAYGYDDEFAPLSCSKHIFTAINLSENDILSLAAIVGSASSFYPQDWEENTRLYSFVLWPPPPQYSTSIMFIRGTEGYETAMGGYSRYWGEGHVFYSDLTNGIFNPFRVCNGTTIQHFMDSASQQAVIFYYTYQHEYDSGEPPPDDDVYTERREIKLFGPSTSDTTTHIIPLRSVLAQCDQSETRRLIVNFGGSTCALNPISFDTLWFVSQHIADEIARFKNSPDERILRRNGAAFDVYSASDGSFLDRTSALTGALQYIIRHPNRESDFVTLENATRTVRIYTTALAPKDLTCYYSSDNHAVQLRWQGVEGATRYFVYTSAFADGPYQLVETIPAGTTTYTPVMDRDLRFYQVSAEFDH
jgi:hypothetical protein